MAIIQKEVEENDYGNCAKCDTTSIYLLAAIITPLCLVS